VRPLEPLQYRGPVEVSLGEPGIEGDCPVEGRERLLPAPQILEHDAAVQMRRGVAGVERNGGVVISQRRFGSFQPFQCQAPVAVRGRPLGLHADGAADPLHGTRRISGARGDHAQHVQALVMPGLGLQDLGIQGLRLRQRTGEAERLTHLDSSPTNLCAARGVPSVHRLIFSMAGTLACRKSCERRSLPGCCGIARPI